MANATSTQLQELYVAYFGRAADPTGLDYWKESGITTAAFAANMYAQPEFKSAYGSLTTESQVNQIYKNLFDREADVTGLTYWTQQIKLGNLQLAEIANHLIWAAQNNSGSADDKKALTNRTEAAEAYTAKIKESTAGILAYQPLHNGLGEEDFSAGVNITEAVSYLSGIDKDTAFDAAGVAASVAKITDNGVPSPNAKTYTLTSNTDNLTGSTGKDVYQGVYDADGTGTGTTATSGDSMVGGTGDDTFNLSITGASGADRTISGINADVEKILISNYDTDGNAGRDHFFDASLSDGVETVGLSSSNADGDTEFTNLKSLVDVEMSSGSGDLKITHVESAVKGLSDSITLTLSGQTAGKFTETAASTGVETVNVVSKGSANTLGDLVSGNNTISTVNVSGDQNLTLTDISSNGLKTVDASSFTGKLTVGYNVAVDLAVTGGSGDDTIVFGSTNTMTKGDVIDGGAGNDVLSVADTIASITPLSNVSNVETLKIVGNYDVTLAADASVMDFDFTDVNENILNLNAGVTSPVTVTVGVKTSGGADRVINTANVGLTVKGLAEAINDVERITGGSGTDTIEITGDNVDATINLATQKITKVETITVIDAGDETVSGATKPSGYDVNITTGAQATALTIDGSALDAANKDNDGDGDIDSSDSSEETLTVVGTEATAVLTITGGAGADTITSGTKNDIIDGGAGADSITSTGGNDNFKGGAGNDTFTFTTTLTKDDVVDGGAGTDILSVTALDAAAMVGVTNVETLKFAGSSTLSSDLPFDTLDVSSASGDSITFATGYTKASTVKVGAGDSVINNAKLTLSVTGTAGDFSTSDNTIVTGSSSTKNDSISITADSGTVLTDGLITNVNTITVVDAGDLTSGASKRSGEDFTLNLTNYATALTVDASALDAANVDDVGGDGKITEADGSAEKLVIVGASTKALTITGGGSDDTILGSSDSGAGDTLKGGTGADTFDMGAGNLTYLDTIDGGDGTDIIHVDQDVTDVDFMNVSNMETLTLDEGGTSINVLGAYFNATGITTVNLGDGGIGTISAAGTSGNITYVSQKDQAEAITAGLGNDSFVFDGTFDLTAADAIAGGAGTDTIVLNNSAAAVTAVVNIGDKVSGVEKIVIKDADGSSAASAQVISVTIDGNNIAGVQGDNSVDNEDVSIEIDLTTITDTNDTTTVVASDIADKDYSFVIKGAASADDITGSGVVDTISGNGGNDAIVAGAGNDVVDGGAGNDTITGGTGQDTMTGGSGNDIFKFALGSSEATNAKPDTITDFTTSSDTIRISLTTAGATYDFTNKGTATDASSSIEKLSSGNGQYLFNTTTSSLVLDTDGNGLLQAGDFNVALTGVSALSDADVAFDITGTTAADTIVTGAGNDTVSLGHINSGVNTGKGDDTVSIGNLAMTSHASGIHGGAGTDTIAVTAASADLKAYDETKVSGFETITISNDANIILSKAIANDFNTVTAPKVIGTAAGGNESLKVTLADAANEVLDISSVVFSDDANAVIIANAAGNARADVITTGNGNDYLSGLDGVDTLDGKAGNDTYAYDTTAEADKFVATSGSGTNTMLVAANANFSTLKIGTTGPNAAATSSAAGVGDLSNIGQVILTTNSANVGLASQFSGLTVAVNTTGSGTANTLELDGTSGDDTINLAGIVGTAGLTYTASTGDDATGLAWSAHADDLLIVDALAGADTITLPTYADINAKVVIDAGESVAAGRDKIYGWALGDVLDFTIAKTAIHAGATIGGIDNLVQFADDGNIKSMIVVNGFATFKGATAGTGADVEIDSVEDLNELLADLAAAASTKDVAKSFAFTATGTGSSGTTSHFIWAGGDDASAGADAGTLDTLVELVNPASGLTKLGSAAAATIGLV